MLYNLAVAILAEHFLLMSHASKPPSHASKPLSHQYAVADITKMPVDDYGGFYNEDETVEQEFALKHERTTSNSKVCTSTPIMVLY